MATHGPNGQYSWEEPFVEALGRGDLASAVAALREEEGSKRRLRVGEVRRAIALLKECAADPQARLSWATRLFEERLSTTLGVWLMVAAYTDRPSDVAGFVERLAEDSDWERREDAAWLLSELLVAHFDQVYARCRQWVLHPSRNVRRAVAVAVKRASKARVPAWGERFLDLLEPLLCDRDVYVRKNLGPFAIGDGLLRCYPELTLKRLEVWAHRPDQGTRWNVAMAFSSAEGAQHIEAALPILTLLAADERLFVWRAVASAMRNLGRRQPQAVVPQLRDWLKDEKPRQAAEVALRYIAGSDHA
jgi:3-methyladenine DNA glycosylase AlkC